MDNATIDLVWVSEAPDKPETRAVNRHMVFSKARNHVVRTSKQHKARWKTGELAQSSLVLRELRPSASAFPPNQMPCDYVEGSTLGTSDGTVLAYGNNSPSHPVETADDPNLHKIVDLGKYIYFL